MLRLACLGSQFVGQFREQKLEGVELVWTGSDARQFREALARLKPNAVVIDFAEAGALDELALRETLEALKPELAIVTYDFGRRKFLRDLQSSTGARLLQSPVSLDMLRAHLAPFIVLHSLRPGAPAPAKEATVMSDDPRFSREQLGRLMEIQSTIQCECPNHVAQIVEKLQAFEAYSRDCENRDAQDAKVHASLYAITKLARREMEKALTLLVEHEKIDLAA
jgi:hypothetical protein